MAIFGRGLILNRTENESVFLDSLRNDEQNTLSIEYTYLYAYRMFGTQIITLHSHINGHKKPNEKQKIMTI